MCRIAVTLNPESKEVESRLHAGTCVNALWFDRDGDTVILCAHPMNDLAQPPYVERTLSREAWADIVKALEG